MQENFENKTNFYSFFYHPFLDFFNLYRISQKSNNSHFKESYFGANPTRFVRELADKADPEIKYDDELQTKKKKEKYDVANFANLNQQISQTFFTLTLEGTFKKNKILIEIKRKPNFLIQHKKNSFILTMPLSYNKGIINKEIPTTLPPINSISNFSFPFLSKKHLWDSFYSQ